MRSRHKNSKSGLLYATAEHRRLESERTAEDTAAVSERIYLKKKSNLDSSLVKPRTSQTRGSQTGPVGKVVSNKLRTV